MQIYRRIIRLSVILVVLLFAMKIQNHLVYANLPAEYDLPGGYKMDHPRLPHPGQDFLQRLSNNQKALQSYTEWADSFDPSNPRNLNIIRSTLVAYLATRSESYLTKIKQLASSPFENFEIYSHLEALSIAYDWCYNDLDEQTRQAFVTKIDTLCKAWINQWNGIGVCPYNDVVYIRCCSGIVIGALAIYPDSPNAKSHYDFAVDVLFNKYLPVWQQIIADGGGWHEGIEYVNNGIGATIYPIFSAWSEVTGENLFQSNSGIADFILYPIYTTRPDQTPVRIADVAWCISRDYPDLMGLSMKYGSPYGVHWAKKTLEYGSGIPLGFEPSGWPWGEPDTPQTLSKPPDDLPLQHYFRGWGVVVMRSDWSEDATFATFKCGNNYWSHQHFDNGAFTIYKRGALAIDSGTYSAGSGSPHHQKYAMQSIAHNIITVTDPHDDNYTNNKWNLPNDGGQRRVGSFYTSWLKDYDAWKAQEEVYNMGKIKQFNPSNNYDYILADVTAAYTNKNSDTGDYRERTSRVKKFLRSFVFYRPDCFIIFDRITSFNANFKKRWLFHSINKPQIDASTVTFTRADLVKHTYSWPRELKYKTANSLSYQYDGKLYLKILLPTNYELKDIGGPGHEFEACGVNYNTNLSGIENLYEPYADEASPIDPTRGPQEPGSWRIEISPANPDTFDIFLNVCYATTASSGNSIPPTGLIESSDGDPMYGAIIKSQDMSRLVMFSASYSLVNNIKYVVEDQQDVQHLLCDLEPNQTFSILKNGNFLVSSISTESGTFHFIDNPSGKVEYELRLGNLSAVENLHDDFEPTGYSLLQNYPNPFNDTTILIFTIQPNLSDMQTPTTLKIYTINGELVKTVVANNLNPGQYRAKWDGKDDNGNKVSSGIYLCSLLYGNFTATKKMLFLQ